MAILTTLLEQLESAQLVRRLAEEDLAYLFKHALTQESAYESIVIRRRREIHRRIAEAYEQLYPGCLDEFAAALAPHFAQAADDENLTFRSRAKIHLLLTGLFHCGRIGPPFFRPIPLPV